MPLRKREFTNQLLQVLQLMWNWGMRRGLCESVNPIFGVERFRKPRGAPVKNRPWTDKELEIVLNAASPPIRVAIMLGAYAGLRESDVVKIEWNCYDGNAIETRQSKTGAPVWVPAHYKLREILDATPRVRQNQSSIAQIRPEIVIGEKGQPYTPDTLRNLFLG